jgi:hypothetical protein
MALRKVDEFLMPVALQAAADDLAFQEIEGGKQGGGGPRLRGGRLLRL